MDRLIEIEYRELFEDSSADDGIGEWWPLDCDEENSEC